MKLFRYLAIFLCLLMYCEIYAQGKAEKGPTKYGEMWNRTNEQRKGVYLAGLRDGMAEGNLEVYKVIAILREKGYITYSEGAVEQIDLLLSKMLWRNFPEIDVVKDVMTKFYADPSNKYLEFPDILLISVAKIRGASPELIEKMLATARKDSYEREYSVSLRELFYKEVLKVK